MYAVARFSTNLCKNCAQAEYERQAGGNRNLQRRAILLVHLSVHVCQSDKTERLLTKISTFNRNILHNSVYLDTVIPVDKSTFHQDSVMSRVKCSVRDRRPNEHRENAIFDPIEPLTVQKQTTRRGVDKTEAPLECRRVRDPTLQMAWMPSEGDLRRLRP